MALTASEIKRINKLLLAWYKVSARPLKIRERSDPYAVLIVEVMAQQTQISRVDEFAERFLKRFPTLRALARAETADVLEAWRGLGYNRRALLLHRAAEAADALGGIPTDVEALLHLPGIGPYTARAVAAIAGEGREIPVDVNIARVVQRLVGGRRLTPKPLQVAANDFGAHLKRGEAGRWAQAAMDLASSTCRSVRPACTSCPLRSVCRSEGRVRSTKKNRAARSTVRFEATQRWLRGRLLDELRDAGATGVRVRGSRGEHGAVAVRRAITRLVGEGLAEQIESGAYRLPRRKSGEGRR
jgi:A/G-specific adenine glycosylase